MSLGLPPHSGFPPTLTIGNIFPSCLYVFTEFISADTVHYSILSNQQVVNDLTVCSGLVWLGAAVPGLILALLSQHNGDQTCVCWLQGKPLTRGSIAEAPFKLFKSN